MVTLIGYGQNNMVSNSIKSSETTITSLKYRVNSTQDIKTLNWNDVKSFFKKNKADDVIEIGFEIDLKESKNKFKGSFMVSGQTKNIDSLTKRAKKMLSGLIKISKKYENN